MTLKAIAVDDEPMALAVVQAFSEKTSLIELTTAFTNPLEALAHLRQCPVDLVFLDINMPDITGLDWLAAVDRPPMVIFTTAYSDHAVQGFDLNAVDYLLKPFSLSRFLKACNKAWQQYEHSTHQQSKTQALFIKSGYDQIRVDPDTIHYVESYGNYVQFVLINNRITSRLTMAEVEALLPESTFVRIHRSYIVSRIHVRKFDRRSVWIDARELPVGALYQADLASRLQR